MMTAKELTDHYRLDPKIAGKINALKKNARTHNEVDLALEEINRLIEGYGVEVVRGRPWVDHFYQDINLLYVNMGDTYAPTVIYDTLKERFYITTWGDIIERQVKRFDI